MVLAELLGLMDLLFGHPFCGDIPKGMIFCYVDDICIASEDLDTHILLLKRLHERIKSANLTNFEKVNSLGKPNILRICSG